jgi:predicted TIM-barrel fold metal-dependent hydrolase
VPLYDGPIVDAHHHLWKLGDNRYPWLERERRERMVFGATEPLARDYLVEDYLADVAGQNVVKSVHVEAGFDRTDPVAETRWLQSIADRHGFPHGIVAWASLEQPVLPEILREHRRYPNLRGIRAVASWHPDPTKSFNARNDIMHDPAWLAGVGAVRDAGLSLDLLVNSGQLADVHRLALKFSDLSIIVNHAGSPVDRNEAGMRQWQDGISLLAQAPNVAMKISDLCAYDHAWSVETYRPIVATLIESFGVDRCMFASDFPVAKLHGTFGQHFDAFRMIASDLPSSCLSRLFCENAIKFYRLY